jgi:S1-C subfamily serine protease
MSLPRFSTWQVIGIVAGVLALGALTCTAGIGVGYAWGRAAGRASLPMTPMFQQDWMHPFDDLPGAPPFELPRQGGPAYLGITYSPLSAEEAEGLGLPAGEGARVVEVVQGGPAAQAGVRDGDVILAVDGERVRPPDGLRRLILSRNPGDEVELTVLRSGRELTLAVVLGSSE